MSSRSVINNMYTYHTLTLILHYGKNVQVIHEARL